MINEVKKLMFEEIELIENKDMKNKLQDIMNNDDFLNHDMIQLFGHTLMLLEDMWVSIQ